jgi:hypothetical protein
VNGGARVGVASAPPVTRAVTWTPLLGGGLAALALAAYLRSRHVDAAVAVAGLRGGAVLLAAGVAFALDDPAGATLASSPTPVGARRTVRVLLAAAASAALWALLLAVTGPVLRPAAGSLTVEAAGMASVALASAAAARPWVPNGLGGVAGGPTLVLLLLASFVAQRSWPRWTELLPDGPAGPAWAAAHRRWAVILAAGAATLVLTALDPARRGISRRPR